MEVVTFSVLSAFVVNALCIVSYMYYKKCIKSSTQSNDADGLPNKVESKKNEPRKAKQNLRKIKKNKPPTLKKKLTTQDHDIDSDTESFTTEDQLAQIILREEFIQDSINTTAVNAKPTIKKFHINKNQNQKSKNHKKVGSPQEDEVKDPDWESVTNRKHKKKIDVIKCGEDSYKFTLDEEGGILEIPFCEIHFPGESLTKALDVKMQIEKYNKFVDDAEDKVFLTPALHFTTGGESRLERRFTIHLNTLKMMGRGWNGSVCGQIETRDAAGSWNALGRVEYIFGKPIQIVHDQLTSFRVVITRGQNGSITRTLSVAAYIAKSKLQNPNYHLVNLCVYDKSMQTGYKVEANMQKNILKMPAKDCLVPFGSDLQFKILPTQKFSPEDKEVFIRWTEMCKANVNVRFLVRLTKNKLKDPNFEAEYRTKVFLSISKVGTTLTTTQEEYFTFYWISGNVFAGRKKWNKQKPTVKDSKDKEKLSEDDGFASGLELVNSESEKRINQPENMPDSPKRTTPKVKPELIPTTFSETTKTANDTEVKKQRSKKPRKPKKSEISENSESRSTNISTNSPKNFAKNPVTYDHINGTSTEPRDDGSFQLVSRKSKARSDEKKLIESLSDEGSNAPTQRSHPTPTKKFHNDKPSGPTRDEALAKLPKTTHVTSKTYRQIDATVRSNSQPSKLNNLPQEPPTKRPNSRPKEGATAPRQRDFHPRPRRPQRNPVNSGHQQSPRKVPDNNVPAQTTTATTPAAVPGPRVVTPRHKQATDNKFQHPVTATPKATANGPKHLTSKETQRLTDMRGAGEPLAGPALPRDKRPRPRWNRRKGNSGHTAQTNEKPN